MCSLGLGGAGFLLLCPLLSPVGSRESEGTGSCPFTLGNIQRRSPLCQVGEEKAWFRNGEKGHSCYLGLSEGYWREGLASFCGGLSVDTRALGRTSP